MRFSLRIPALCLILATVASTVRAEEQVSVLVSVPDQKLVLVQNGLRIAQFPVSTSKFGLGDRPRTYATPLGTLAVASKVGAGAPQGAVFKGRRRTGEVLRPNAPGRDPIVTRILHLRGLEARNARAYSRGIYIHGTAEERRIGRPASYGCIRMKSRDVVRVFNAVPVGAKVEIVNQSVSRAIHEMAAGRNSNGPAS
jgi:lipoprotein-anchoring transpeptidase ErfK/SrfK